MSKHGKKLVNEAKKLIGKNWSVSSGTRTKLLRGVTKIAEFSASKGLQSIQDLKSKHVNEFFRDLDARGLSASTCANYATAMRTVAHAIGKDNIVPKHNASLGINRDDRYAPKTASLTTMESVRAKLAEKAEWLGLASDMQRAFGLRLKESLMSNKVVTSNGHMMLVVEGAKGGRPRQIPIDSPEKHAAIRAVSGYIERSGGQSIIPNDLTLKQGCKKFTNEHHRAGGTKAALANPHLWRHESAQGMERDGKTDKEIAEHLGHGRECVVKHYCGKT